MHELSIDRDDDGRLAVSINGMPLQGVRSLQLATEAGSRYPVLSIELYVDKLHVATPVILHLLQGVVETDEGEAVIRSIVETTMQRLVTRLRTTPADRGGGWGEGAAATLIGATGGGDEGA